MTTVKSTINNAASTTGVSRTTVIIVTLTIMFVLFTAARGTLPKYKAALFN